MFGGAALSTGKVDSAFFFIVAISFVFFLIVMAAMVWFVVRYRRKRHPESGRVKESTALEIVWTVIPLLLVLLMFYFGWVNFTYIRNPPKDAMVVNVTGRQWSWLFTYGDGREEDVLRVPAGRPVDLVLTSTDVIHSFFVPAFRIKEDCVPGMKTHLWFEATVTGSYEVFCTEYCGEGHSHMRSQVIVMSPADFEAWTKTPEKKMPGEAGFKVLQAKGCLGCHSTDGTKKVGPTLKGLLGRSETVVTAGKKRTITVDAAYVKSYILNPNADAIPGYSPVMPKIDVTAKEMDAIVTYLETLK